MIDTILKLNQYFFAPKDDPYHNKKWRELYPEEKLAEIRELARVGNQSKTRYVWTIHPFMNNRIRFGNEAHYQEDLATIKAKFTQLMKVGVREFGIPAFQSTTWSYLASSGCSYCSHRLGLEHHLQGYQIRGHPLSSTG